MTEKELDVSGIGHALVDIIAPCTDSFLVTLGLTKGAMRLTSPEEAAALHGQMEPSVETSGGSVANTCAGIASLGGRAGFMGKVGTDAFADVFTHDIRAAGVAYANSRSPAQTPTGRCLILVTPDGERTMNTNLGAAAEFSEAGLDTPMIATSQILYLEGYLFDPEPARAAFFAAAEQARKHGTKISLTLSDPFLVDRHRQDFLRFIRTGIDLLFANEQEMRSLYETDDFEKASRKLKQDCPLSAITCSEKGSVIFTSDASIAIPPEPVEHVADATGAGDLYAAGFLFGLARGEPLEICGALGSMAAAEVIGHVGPRPQRPLARLAREKGLLSA